MLLDRACAKYNRCVGLPFFIFWVLLLLCREELGWRWSLICIGIWALLLAGTIVLGELIAPKAGSYLFVAAQSLFDAILILVIFKGDISIY